MIHPCRSKFPVSIHNSEMVSITDSQHPCKLKESLAEIEKEKDLAVLLMEVHNIYGRLNLFS